tara:strand:- start:59306 stop:60250 length:945 start_codon:yes stop_codon:yes gene_type:complete
MQHVLVLTLLFTLVGCGLASPKRSGSVQLAKAPVSTVPVPYQARPGEKLKKRIMVLPFLDEKLTRNNHVKELARRSVVRELLRTNEFVVINNNDFPTDLAKFLNESNEYDIEKIAKVAHGLGISSVLEGKIMEVRAKRIGDQVGLFREIKAQVETRVRIRLAASKNGKVLMNEERSASIESSTTRFAEHSYSDRQLEQDPMLVNKSVLKAFYSAIGNVVRTVDKIDWEGRIAMVSGDRVFINAGRLSGLQVGDILKVTEPGEEIFDPERGLFLGYAPGRMKGTLEVVSYFGKDGSITVVHSGSGFSENDRVELY